MSDSKELKALENKRILKERARKRQQTRAYEAAGGGRLLHSWIRDIMNVNEDIQQDHDTLVARSRDLVNNDAFGKQYVRLQRDNIIGPDGALILPQVKKADATLDAKVNTSVRNSFEDWGKNAQPDGTNWVQSQQQFAGNWATNGEVIIQFLHGPKYGKYGFAIKFIDTDHLDIQYNTMLKNGNIVIGSVEIDSDGVVLALWLWQHHPDDKFRGKNGNKRIRVPSTQVIYANLKDYPSQVRGVPPMHNVMKDFHHLKEYQVSETIASRLSASKGGVITEPEDTEDDHDVDNGVVARKLEAGQVDVLPFGSKFDVIDPKHPQGNFPAFVVKVLERIAAGLGVSYYSLSGDVSKANYSSLRQAALLERDQYRTKQTWVNDVFHVRVYHEWLKVALLRGLLDVPKTKVEMLFNPVVKNRGWNWVDPKHDIDASEKAIANKLDSRTNIVSKQGRDFRQVLEEIKAEEELMQEMGISSQQVASNTSNQSNNDNQSNENDEG